MCQQTWYPATDSIHVPSTYKNDTLTDYILSQTHTYMYMLVTPTKWTCPMSQHDSLTQTKHIFYFKSKHMQLIFATMRWKLKLCDKRFKRGVGLEQLHTWQWGGQRDWCCCKCLKQKSTHHDTHVSSLLLIYLHSETMAVADWLSAGRCLQGDFYCSSCCKANLENQERNRNG